MERSDVVSLKIGDLITFNGKSKERFPDAVFKVIQIRENSVTDIVGELITDSDLPERIKHSALYWHMPKGTYLLKHMQMVKLNACQDDVKIRKAKKEIPRRL